MEAKEYLEQLVANAREAQAEFETYPQEKVDAACRAVCKAVYDNAEMLAHMAVDETRMGPLRQQDCQVPQQVQDRLAGHEG